MGGAGTEVDQAQGPVHREKRAEVIREGFLEEVRFQASLKDHKDKDHRKQASGAYGKRVKNVHPRKSPPQENLFKKHEDYNAGDNVTG